MDPLTHSALGIVCAVAAASKKAPIGAVALAGLAGGLLPDADIFLTSEADPLFNIEYHRHFSHSFALSPVVGGVAAVTAWCLLRLFGRKVPLKPLLLPAVIAVLAHIFCDLWTSYGTRAGWPFVDARFGLHWVSVVDPILTIPLLVLALIASLDRSRRMAQLSLLWVACYLTVAVVQKHRAADMMENWIAAQNGDASEWRTVVKPSFANIIVWRALASKDGVLHVFAIRCAFGSPQLIAGGTTPMFHDAQEAQRYFRLDDETTQARDIRRFHHFSDGWLGIHPDDPNLLADLRYAALPNEVAPMWGIRMKPDDPQGTIEWVNGASLENRPWVDLWRMIRGDYSSTAPAS
jgi:inner membrane protein